MGWPMQLAPTFLHPKSSSSAPAHRDRGSELARAVGDGAIGGASGGLRDGSPSRDSATCVLVRGRTETGAGASRASARPCLRHPRRCAPGTLDAAGSSGVPFDTSSETSRWSLPSARLIACSLDGTSARRSSSTSRETVRDREGRAACSRAGDEVRETESRTASTSRRLRAHAASSEWVKPRVWTCPVDSTHVRSSWTSLGRPFRDSARSSTINPATSLGRLHKPNCAHRATSRSNTAIARRG